MYICQRGACVGNAHRGYRELPRYNPHRGWYAIKHVPAAGKVTVQRLIKLRRGHSECFLDGLLHGLFLILQSIEINGQLRNKLIVIEIMHRQSGLGIKCGSAVTGFVISLGMLLHSKQVRNLHHSQLLQDLKSLVRDISDASFLVVNFDIRKVLSKAFLEPRIEGSRHSAIHQLMRVLVEDNPPRVLDRHIEHDEAAILPTLEQPR